MVWSIGPRGTLAGARRRSLSGDMLLGTTTPPPALIQAGFTAEDAQGIVPMHGKGCEKCNNTGYKGRVGLYEVMEVTEELRELILVGASSLELRRKAVDEGMLTLRSSGLRKVKDGVTTIEEIVRETVK